METLKSRASFKNATILLSLFNLITALFLLHGFFSTSSHKYSPIHPNPDMIWQLDSRQFIPSGKFELRYIKESEEIRRAMQPLALIRRVREIEQEVYAESETVQHKDTKQTAAFDLSKRLTNARTNSDAASLKALEEWRKRKVERARHRESGRNTTLPS